MELTNEQWVQKAKAESASCQQIKQQLRHDSEACIYPYLEDQLAFRVQKWVTYKNTTIHCDFFERELGWRFYVYKNRFYIIKGKEFIFKNFSGCGWTEAHISELLYKENRGLFLVFLCSLFSRLCITTRAAAAAAYAARNAARAAADDDARDAYDAAAAAAYAARNAARAAYHAARKAAALADADAAYDAYDAADAAYDAACDAAYDVYAAAVAVFAAARDAAARDAAALADAAVYAAAAAAFRSIMKLRRTIMKEVGE